MNALTQQTSRRQIAQADVVVIRPHVLRAIGIIASGFPAWSLAPEARVGWDAILGGIEPGALEHAALEYCRQRGKPPTAAGEVGQIAGWLLRARRSAQTHTRRETDAFADQFLQACGDDTRAWIATRKCDALAAEDDHDHVARMLEKARVHRDAGHGEASYWQAYIASLEARMQGVTL